MSTTIIKATDEHAVMLSSTLRRADSLELRRMTRHRRIDVIRESMASSITSWVWLVDGEPGCMFGVACNCIGDLANPWLLGTQLVSTHRKAFWRDCKAITEVMFESYPKLVGYCDAQYGASLRWLQRLGFTLEGPMPFGDFGAPFYRYTRG